MINKKLYKETLELAERNFKSFVISCSYNDNLKDILTGTERSKVISFKIDPHTLQNFKINEDDISFFILYKEKVENIVIPFENIYSVFDDYDNPRYIFILNNKI